MAETVRKKHVREPPSVPFIWEIKPGIPKKDWKPEICSINHLPKPLLKQTASVPFVWEEKPGTPLHNFSVNSVPPKPDTILIHVASSSGYSLASNYSNDHKDTESNNDESITSLDLEAFETSSETDSSTSSYETGRSSPIGATFLECLFPLYPSKSGFLERNENLVKVASSSLPEPKSKDFCLEDLTSDLVKRPPTLGELIMMSRRRSYRRKAVQMRKWDPPKNITRKQAFGCFSMLTSNNMMEGLLKKKYYPKLKPVSAGYVGGRINEK